MNNARVYVEEAIKEELDKLPVILRDTSMVNQHNDAVERILLMREVENDLMEYILNGEEHDREQSVLQN